MEPLLLTFAIDVSKGDAEVAAKVRQLLALPPASPQEIGFYGDPDTMPLALRQWLATVSLLATRGHVTGFEDKYSDEIVAVWASQGLFDFNMLPDAAQAVWGIIADGLDIGDDGEPDSAQLETVWNGYALAAAAIEDAVKARGKVLVSIDATDGDTLFFAALDPAVAERWVGTGFVVLESYGQRQEIGVRPPRWDRLWEHLLYALDDVPEAFEARGMPPGLGEAAPLRF